MFTDTGEPTVETWERRPCGECGLSRTSEGHDGCLGTLPGVINACCGHGDADAAYVQFEDGMTVRGHAALEFFNDLRSCGPGDKKGRNKCRNALLCGMLEDIAAARKALTEPRKSLRAALYPDLIPEAPETAN